MVRHLGGGGMDRRIKADLSLRHPQWDYVVTLYCFTPTPGSPLMVDWACKKSSINQSITAICFQGTSINCCCCFF